MTESHDQDHTTTESHEQDHTTTEHDPDAVPERGDDERENRERIEQTGEQKTDALGNADGAS